MAWTSRARQRSSARDFRPLSHPPMSPAPICPSSFPLQEKRISACYGRRFARSWRRPTLSTGHLRRRRDLDRSARSSAHSAEDPRCPGADSRPMRVRPRPPTRPQAIRGRYVVVMDAICRTSPDIPAMLAHLDTWDAVPAGASTAPGRFRGAQDSLLIANRVPCASANNPDSGFWHFPPFAPGVPARLGPVHGVHRLHPDALKMRGFGYSSVRSHRPPARPVKYGSATAPRGLRGPPVVR